MENSLQNKLSNLKDWSILDPKRSNQSKEGAGDFKYSTAGILQTNQLFHPWPSQAMGEGTNVLAQKQGTIQSGSALEKTNQLRSLQS